MNHLRLETQGIELIKKFRVKVFLDSFLYKFIIVKKVEFNYSEKSN